MSRQDIVRTPERPMVFSQSEFLRGALAAWLWFLILATGLYTLLFGIYVVVAASYFIPWSFVGLVGGTPVAYLLGLALRTVTSRWVHVMFFALLGALVGVTLTSVAGLAMGNIDTTTYWTYNVPLSAVAVPLGWWWTVRSAVTSDAASSQASPGKSDPAFEASL